jgi:hypothetical protein
VVAWQLQREQLWASGCTVVVCAAAPKSKAVPPEIDPADEQQGRQNHPRLDRNCKVSKHGECERHQSDTDVGLGQFRQLWNLPPLAHVVSHEHQNSSQQSSGYTWSAARQTQDADRVNDSGHRCLRAGTYIGRGTRNRSPGGEAAEPG